MRAISISYSQQKRSDTMVTYYMTLYDDGNKTPLSADNTYRMMITCDGSLVTPTGIELKVEDNQLVLDSDQLNLPAGVYRFEVWVEHGNDKAIYPDDGMKRLEINQNATDLPAGEVSSMTLDAFMQKFKEMVKQSGGGSDVQLDVANRTITVDDKSIKIPQEVDLSNVVTQDDLAARLSQYAKTSDIDLTPYLKTADADSKYATQAELSNYATNTSVEDKTKGFLTSDSLTTALNASRHAPTACRGDFSNPDDYYFAFDNDSEIHFAKGIGGMCLGLAWGYGSNGNNTSFKRDQQFDNVLAYLHSYLLLDSIKKATANNFDVYQGVRVVNPLNDVDKYNWTAAQLTADAGVLTQGQLDFVQSWYAVGLFNDAQIESLGAVKK